MRKLIAIFMLSSAMSSIAQDSNSIVTDRPTQSAASAVQAKGDLLVEYGFVSEKAGDFTNITLANLLLRYGVIDGVEIRITQNINQVSSDLDDSKVSGLSPLTIGTKVHLVEENGAVPQISVIGQVTLNNGEEAFKPGETIPELRLNFSNTLSESLSLGYNLGMAFPQDNSQTFYTLVLGYAVSTGVTVFAEPYGFFQDGVSDHRFNTGVIYLAKENFQLDLSGGFGLSDVSPDFFIGFGAAIGF